MAPMPAGTGTPSRPAAEGGPLRPPPARRWLWALTHVLVRLPRPTGVGLTLLIASLIAAVVGAARLQNLLLLLGVLAAGLVLAGVLLPPFMLHSLTVSRTLPRRAMAGVPVAIEVRLRGPRRWPGVPTCTVRDQPSPTGGGGGVAYVPGGTRAVDPGVGAVYHTRFRRRGRHRFGVYLLETAAPFGFARSVRAGVHPEEILVLPRVRRVTLPPLPQTRVPARHQTLGRPSRAALDEDFAGLREWRPGESPRHIHWRTSARLRRLVIREHEAPSDRRVTVALETALPDSGGSRGQALARFERAVALTASVCAALDREGVAYRLALGGQRPLITRFGHGRRHLDAMLTLLAEVPPDPVGTAGRMHASLDLAAPRDAACIWVRLDAADPPAVPGGTACVRPGESGGGRPKAVGRSAAYGRRSDAGGVP